MSVQLSVALNIAAPIWEKMYFNGVSLERAMRNDLKGEIKGAVQSLLYCAHSGNELNVTLFCLSLSLRNPQKTSKVCSASP